MAKRVGILSDTHGYWDERYAKYFAECDEIWHCGDIGSVEVLEKLQSVNPVRAVYGNIDSQDVRLLTAKHQCFDIEGASVWITHIGGYPGHYSKDVVPEIYHHPPKLFISGHSHILKVMFDKTLNLLHINPGAAGIYGFHKTRTLVRLTVESGEFKDLEVIELSEDKKQGRG